MAPTPALARPVGVWTSKDSLVRMTRSRGSTNLAGPPAPGSQEQMKKQEFLDIFDEELFCVGMQARSKEAALSDLVEFLFSKKRVNNKAVLTTLLERAGL